MPLELFERLVDETAPYVRSYSLFNWGEPLLVQDFRERVLYVNAKKRPDCNVEISTNGMLLDERMIAFLAEQEVDIIISVDGANKADFERIRRGGSFERIMLNAQKAAAAYHHSPPLRSPEFYISIQKENQCRILDIAQLACTLGIRRIGCGLVVSPIQYAADQNEDLCRELECAYRFIHENNMLLDVYPTKVGNWVFVDGAYQNVSGYLVSTMCHAPLVSAAVSYSGDVYLCCNKGASVGNILHSSFLELWKSEAYQELRRIVNDPVHMPQPCRSCPWFNRNGR